MKLCLMMIVLCSACASAPVLPAVGGALQKVKDSYVKIDDISSRAEKLVNAVCAPDVVQPAAAEQCAAMQSELPAIDSARDGARQAINEAIDVYTVVNKAAGGE